MTANEMIYREVQVCETRIVRPIHYVQYTNRLPITVHLEDFDILEGSTGTFTVKKPSGRLESGSTILGTSENDTNVIMFTPKTTTFDEYGNNVLQYKIEKDGEVLSTFELEVIVHRNCSFVDSPEGGNHGDIFGGMRFEKISLKDYLNLDTKSRDTEYFVQNGNKYDVFLGDQMLCGDTLEDAVCTYVYPNFTGERGIPPFASDLISFFISGVEHGTYQNNPSGWMSFIEWWNSGYTTRIVTNPIYPDFNGDGKITDEEFEAMFFYEADVHDKKVANVRYSWEKYCIELFPKEISSGGISVINNGVRINRESPVTSAIVGTCEEIGG